MKLLTIIILNWNGEELLKRFLPSVIQHSPSELTEIVIADNGSTDGSVELINEKFPRVKILKFDENYGFAKGYNMALKQSFTPYTVLLNNDVEVTSGWLDAPIMLLNSSADIACVQPKIRSLNERTHFEYAGAAGGYIDKYGYPFCKGRILDNVEYDYGQYDKQSEIVWGSGACLFVKTEIYLKEDGLDEYFFAHQEEVDFCWRLRCRGYRIVYTPQSYIFHKGGATLESGNPHKTFLNFRNNLLMVYKNIPDKDLNKVMRIRYWLDLIAALKFVFDRKWGDAKAVLSARKDFTKMKDAYRPVRIANMSKTKVSVIGEIFPGSILWEFYYKSNKTYCSLKGFAKDMF